MNSSVKFQDLCRICLTSLKYVKNPSNIYQTKFRISTSSGDDDNDSDSKNILLSDAIEKITCVKLNQYADMPTNICSTCEKSVINACILKEQMVYSSRKLNALLDGFSGETYNLVTVEDQIEIESTIKSQGPQFNETEISIEKNNTNESAAVELKEKIPKQSSSPTSIIWDVNKINSSEDADQKDFCDDKTIIIKNYDEKNSNNEYIEIVIEQVIGSDENVDIKEPVIKHQPIQSVNNCNTASKQLKSKNNKSEDAVSFLSKENFFKTERVKPVINKIKTTSATDDRKHKCQVCHRQFLRKSNLVDHLRLHANLKLFQCDLCEKSFVQAGNFRAHYRIHTKERPYKCNICYKTYNQSGALKVHMRNHTNEKNYKCDVCDKAFTNSSDLHKHERIHDERKKVACLQCNKLFAQKNNLRNHVLLHHPIDVNNVKIESTEQNPKSKRK